MTPEYILDVTEVTFEYEVISYSKNIPVVVDFWAPWCKPCKTLGPLLEKLTIEGQGAFRLAKVNVDENPNLTLRFNIRTVPTVKAFSQGEISSEFVGLQSEIQIRQFLNSILPPSATTLALEKAESLLQGQQWIEAERIFREIIEQNSEHPVALLGLAKAILAQGDFEEALFILKNFPASPQYAKSEILRPYANALKKYIDDSLPNESEEDAVFINSIRLAKRGNLAAALDGLLEILRRNKRYRNDQARQVFLSILDIMGDQDPLTRQYRTELAGVLF